MADNYRNGERDNPRTGQPRLEAPKGSTAGSESNPSSQSNQSNQSNQSTSSPALLPALSLPKGGGAIRGIGEQFQVNAATGTASLGIPLPVSPGRAGFGPALTLSYDSGSGNSPFGLGFTLSVPSITRRTDRGLPRYYDDEESDEYILSGAEALVPTRDESTGELLEIDRGEHIATRYRPRVEGSFARIERWIHRTTGDVHWRVTSKDNTTSIYGKNAASRIADPKDPKRVFSWLLEESRDDKGNIVAYEYKAEDGTGIDPARLSEKSRFEAGQFAATAQRYLKRVRYCNATPFAASDFLMELVFDYGEHLPEPTPDDTGEWSARPDPFSNYRATFEVRTHRLCQRALMFHRLSPDRAPVLVKSTRFKYERDDQNPSFTYLVAVTHLGHQFESGVWHTGELPTLELDYTRPVLHDELSVLPSASLEGLRGGVDGAHKRWVDLDGEGIPGLLIDDDRAWYYKVNQGQGELAPPRVLSNLPSPASLAGGIQQLEDLGGDGQLDLVSYEPPLSGYFTRTPEGEFEPFRAFPALPNIDFNDPNLRFIDLDGDGHGDLLITDDHVFIWYRSKAKQGFEAARRVVIPSDDEAGPAVVFADPEQSIQLADMSGDGLVDIVRIRRAEVCYWPNLGHGRFGAKIRLENAPVFARPEEFDARRVRFGDVDGSGTSDLFYLGLTGTTLYRNESGNRLAAPEPIRSLPPVDSVTQLGIVDLLGQGTACLVWSSPLPSAEARPVLFVDLMGGIKPHLMRSVVNNLGAETRLSYAPSTKFYLADKAAGNPWLTRLSFPVHVLERVERIDAISNSHLTTTYSYHHGFFDGVEREFHGFARVEQIDAEEFTLGQGTETFQFPTRTVSWFHTGAWLEKERLENALKLEYYPASDQSAAKLAMLLPHTVLPSGLSIQDEREAARALRGSLLRQEIYANDGTERAKIPFLTTEQNLAVKLLQSSRGNQHAVFFTHARESVTVHSERNPDDPRVTHDFVVEVDDFGNLKRKVSLAYARANTAPDVQAEQQRFWATLSQTQFTNEPSNPAFYRVGVAFESKVFELTGLTLPAGGQGLVQLADLTAFLDTLTTELPFETTLSFTEPGRRLIGHQQQLFYAADLQSPLPLGEINALGLPYESYQLALTTGQVSTLATSIVNESERLSGTAFDPALLVTEGKYVQRDAHYWTTSGRALFDATSAQHFYLPKEAVDPFGNRHFIEYDAFDLLAVSTRDPLGNTVQSVNDYRVLAPKTLIDPNLNSVSVAFDALGMVIATAVAGKGTDVGDTLADPTTRLVYDILRWQREQKPTFVHTFAREVHGPSNTKFQESFAYSDGFGRIAMQKVQAEPGDAPLRNADGSLQRDSDGNLVIGAVTARWVGTGRTVFNNKGNPVKQYEPFFSSTPDYENEHDLVNWGVTPIIHYDPLDRVIRTELPNGTESRVTFDVWQQTTFDPNDTVLTSTWYSSRGSPSPTGPEPSDPEQRAAWLASQHANTPAVVHLDALGRAFLSIADNHVKGVGSFFRTRTELDIEGNALAIIDARGIRTIEQTFDVLKRRLSVTSPDAGKRLALTDVAGKPLRGWDSRGQTSRQVYDALQRATHAYVKKGTTERLLLRSVYGEAIPGAPSNNPLTPSTAQALNLRGKPYQLYDCAGLVTNASFDFKGNLLQTSRQLASEYRTEPDWSDAQAISDPVLIFSTVSGLLNAGLFTLKSTYDALNRVTSHTTPDLSVALPTYNEASLLDQLRVQVRGGAAQLVISGIDYNARGQRILCKYANPTSGALISQLRYEYDPPTFRLTRLVTERTSDGALLQDLRYTYDPVGNIVELHDRGATTPIFSGATPVTGDGFYVYDAFYRLSLAKGREHPGQRGPSTQPGPFDDAPSSLPHPNDLQALIRYTEQYSYDEVGNIQTVAHSTTGASNTQWTRRYQYASDSNRLLRTSIPGDAPGTFSEAYGYANSALNNAGAHGSMTSMPHLAQIDWDYADRMHRTDKGGGGQVFFTYDAAGQRVRKVWEHGVVEERIYLGGYEIFRRRLTVGGGVDLERETLHVMDDQRRVAMTETKTQDGGAPVTSPATRWRFQLDNQLGSATLELDEAGKVISYEEYHPYGSTAFSAGSASTEVSARRYRYTGKERDEETGLYYHGARYYAPWLGRWTATDPLGTAAPSETDLNLFAYVGGNPISRNDPTGFQEASLSGPVPPRPGSPAKAPPVGLVDVLNPEFDGQVAPPSSVEQLAHQSDPIPEVVPVTIVVGEPNRHGPHGAARPHAGRQPKAAEAGVGTQGGTGGSGAGSSGGAGAPGGLSPGEQVLSLLGHVALGAGEAYALGALAGAAPLLGLALGAAAIYQLATNFGEIKQRFLTDPNFAAEVIGGIFTPAAAEGYSAGAAARASIPEDALLSSLGSLGRKKGARLEPYGGPGGGHHIPAKRAFEGAPGFDANEALAIPKEEMARLGVDHPTVTGAQQTLYRAFASTGKELTWKAIEDIETTALVRGGLRAQIARPTVVRAIEALKALGIKKPIRIPWGGGG